jgi:RHS repeat-associated protein
LQGNEAEVVGAQDYYPFGMLMPGRQWDNGMKYRYGFNGKENDRDIKGDGNQQDYGMRIYDPRLGRFLSVDPLTASYPWYTPYQFAGNKPIQYIDLDGAEETLYGLAKDGVFGKTGSKIVKGSIEGIALSLKKTWSFFTSDLYKASTWKNAEEFFFQASISMSTVKVGPTPMVDAKVQDFQDNVIDGDSYSRSKYLSEFGTDLLTAYAGSKGMASVKSFIVAKYMSGTFMIGARTLAKVTAHLEELGFATDAGNQVMLSRMEKIAKKQMKATEVDLNFAKHELREAELVKGGMTYEEAHTAVLKEQGMSGINVAQYEKKLYTQEALDASKAQWEKEIKDK